jgi:hypothetical protein
VKAGTVRAGVKGGRVKDEERLNEGNRAAQRRVGVKGGGVKGGSEDWGSEG